MKIFISYRRADSAPYAGRLRDGLEARFGPGSVFFDVSSIDVGETFTPAMGAALALSDVVVVVIGPNWTTVSLPLGGRRLDDPQDLVRAEIRTALDRQVEIIPALVGGAAMPRPDQLPDELKALSGRNACELSDARWPEDVQRLTAAIERQTAERTGVARGPVADALDALQRGRYTDAVDLLTGVLAENPTAEAYYHRGLAYFCQDKPDAALADWNQTIGLAPDWAMAYRQRGNAFAQLDQHDRALADYDRAIELEPREPRAYFNRARLRARAGDFQGAMADLEQVLALRGDAVLERQAEAQLVDLRARHGKPAAGT